ncbi:VOC family protein [Streptomyces sp. NPDC046977]|uniref:VOC family protein n=1 Tax=Streptomyces sp. NPDC046977 TaxID=3154703 RepID=UPI0033F8E834
MTERSDGNEIPDRYRYAVIPHIMVGDAAAAVDFCQRAFGAREDVRVDAPGGGILHAEITVGRSVLMLGDASAEEAEGAPSSSRTPRGTSGSS